MRVLRFTEKRGFAGEIATIFSSERLTEEHWNSLQNSEIGVVRNSICLRARFFQTSLKVPIIVFAS